jgi:hypothetical protein
MLILKKKKTQTVPKKNAYAKSFVPTAASVLNECFERSMHGMRVLSEKY